MIALKDLDPGIRDVCAALWAAGWTTTNWGDGRTKEAAPEVAEVEHVAIVPRPNRLPVDQAHAVASVISAVRPGQAWQVDYTCSVLKGRSAATITAWRHDGR